MYRPKITYNTYDTTVLRDLSFNNTANIRGNNYKLQIQSFHNDLRKYSFLHVLLIHEIACLIQLLMLALLMHLKHIYVSFGSTKDLNWILQPI